LHRIVGGTGRISQSAMRLWGSMPAVGSSRKSTDGRCMTARATMSRWAMPPDSAITGAFARSLNRNRSSTASASERAVRAFMPKNRPWK